MKKLILLIILATGMTIGAGLASPSIDATDFPRQVYDATYVSTGSPAGEGLMRMVSDGKGHVRHEVTFGGHKSVSIINFPEQNHTTLVEPQHLAMKISFSPNLPQITDEISAKRANAKPLGEQVIDGHPCHGYETKVDNGVSQVWIGDDIHFMVRSELDSPRGKQVLALKSWSTATPSPDLFEIPIGYKQMDMSQMMNMSRMNMPGANTPGMDLQKMNMQNMQNIQGLMNNMNRVGMPNLNTPQ